MAELEGLSVSLTADTGGLDRGMRSAEQSVARTERALTASAGRMDQAMERVNRSAALVTQRLNQFSAVLGVGGIAAMAAKTLDYADAWTQVGNRLRLVASDAGQMKATQEQLFQAAQKAGVSMGSVVDVYSRAAQAAGELGASQEQLTRFSGGVAQALAVSGTSAEAASGAMQQLGQLLGSARVQAEEFNSILDGAPRVAKAVADGLTEAGGSVSRLKQLINDGKVTNKQFFDAFLGQVPKIQAEFDKTVPTIGRSLATLNNAMTKMVGEANEATGATTSLAQGIQALGENLNAVAAGVTAVGTAMASVYVARGLVPAVSAGLEFVKAQIALRGELIANTGHILQKEAALRAGAAAAAQAAAADLAAAEAAAVKARSDLAARAAQYEAAVALDAAIGKTARLTQAEEALAAARLARAAADERVAQASIAVNMASQAQASAAARTTAAATLLSRAGAGLSSVMALVGGPWGAAFLAAGTAVYYLSTRTTEADKAQEAYNRTLSDGRQRVQELTSATREQANALLEKQRNEAAAAQDAAAAAQAELAAQEALYKRTGNVRADGSPNQTGVMRQLIEVAETTRKRAQAAAAALDAMNAVGQKTGDAVGLEMASKLSRGTAAFNALNTALSDALKQAGMTVQSGKLMTNEQAETEKAVTALGLALKAGSGFLRSYGTDAQQITGIMAALKLKIDPVASAIADMNRELAQAGAAEGAARTALTVLQGINQQREKEGKAPLTTVSPEYLQLLGKAQEVETKRVESATAARAKVLDLDKQIARAQVAGNVAGVAELQRQKAVEQMVARGTDRKVAEANAAQDYAVAITEAGAAAGQAGKEILLAADAQMVMAQAAGMGEAATRQATYATKLAQEAAKGNGNVMAVAAANRREEAAAIVQIRNETVRSLELETANTNALTLAMASGGAAVRVAQEEEYKLALIRKLGTDATVAGTEAQQALNKAMDAYRANRAANDNNRLQQERQSANDNLALAQRELDLMGQAEPVRERALTSLRNQQEAARKVAELGEDGARQWLAWQEQIADKRAMIDYLKSVQATAKEISGDISEALYDRLMDPNKATSVVDVFKSIFKRIAVAALETQVVLPIVTQVVGAAPGLFGIQSPATGVAAGQGGGMGGIGNLLSLGSKFMPSSWTGGIGNSIATGLNQVGYSMGIGGTAITSGALSGSITGMGAAGMGSAAGGAASAAGVAAVPGGLTNAAVSGAGSGLAPAMAGGASLMSYLGPAAAGLAAGGLIGPMVANGNKAVGGLAGAASGAAAGALIGSVVPGIGTLVGALVGGAGGGLGGLLGTQKPSVGPNSRAILDFTDGAFRTGASAADNGGNEGAVRTLADQISASLNSVLASAGLKSSADLKTIGAVDIMEKDGRYITEVAGQKKEYKDQSAAASALMNDILQKFIQDGATDFVKKDSPQIASNLRKALDASIGKPAEELVANMQLAATDFSKAFDEAGKAQADQLAGAISQVTVSFTTMRDRSQQLGLAVDGLADSADKATGRLIDAATRQAQGKGYIDSAMTVRATFESVGQSLLAAGQSGDKAVKLYGAQMSALVNSLGTGTDALKALSDMAESLSGVDETAVLFARTRADQVRAAVQEDLTLRQAQAQVQLGQVSQDAYDRAALEIAQKRELASVTDAAVKAQLVQVQATERAAQAAKSAAEAQKEFASASGSTRSYLLSLMTGEAGGLSAQDRYRNAQNEYASASAAIGPQATAEQLARQTEAAKALLDASRAMNGSTTEYFRDLANVSTDLARSAQITPDDPVVTAINALKASVDGLGGKVDVQVSVDAITFVRGEIEQTIRTHVSTAGLSLREIQLANGVLDAVDQSVTVALSPATGLTARELQLYQGALSNIDQSITAAVDTSALTGANREIALGQLSDATRTINTALGVFPTMTAEQREFVLAASRAFARTVSGALGTMPNLSAEQQAILLGQTDSFGRTFNAIAGLAPSMSAEQAAILSGTSDSFTRAFNSAVGALPAMTAEQRAVLLGQNGAFTTTFQGIVAGLPGMSVEQRSILLGQTGGFSRTFNGLIGALPAMSSDQRSILLGVSDAFTRVYQQAVGVLPGMSYEQRAILTGYTDSFTKTFQSAAAAMPSMSMDQLAILRGQTDDFTRTFIAATNDLTLTPDEQAVLQAKSEQISRTITQKVETTETVNISRSIDDKLSSILAEIKAQMVAANTNLGTVNKSVVALASPNNPITVTSLFKGGAGMSFETGGVIPGGVVGNGIWGKDSVMARYAGGGTVNLAGGEGILTAPATSAIGGSAMVDFINRTRSLPAASMRPLVMPVVASPRPAASSDAGMAAELKAIREEVAALRRDNNKLIQGQALMEVEAVDRQTSELKLALASKTKHAASAA